MFLLYSNLDKVFSLEQSYNDSHDNSPSSTPNLLHKSSPSPSSTPTRRSKCVNNNSNDNNPRELRKMTSLVIPLTSHSPPPLLSPRSSSSSSLLPSNTITTNNNDEDEQIVTSPLSRKAVNSFDGMRGDLEFFQTKEKVDEHQLSILNFVKAEVVLLETKILVVIFESPNHETSNPHLHHNNNEDQSENGNQFGLCENFISESQNQNFQKVATPLDDKYIIPKNGMDDQDNYFASVAKEYGIDEKSIKTVTTIDLFYSQIYSSFRSDRTNYFTIVNVNGHQKLNYYYFRAGEEKYYEWISKIQRNIKYSLYQKQQLYKRSKSILLTSNYTSSSSVKQMRRSYRCFDDHPSNRKASLGIRDERKEDIIFYENNFMTAIDNDQFDHLRPLVEKILSTAEHRIGERFQAFLNSWKNDRFLIFLNDQENMLKVFIAEVKKFKLSLYHLFHSHYKPHVITSLFGKHLLLLIDDIIFEELYNITFLMYKSFYFSKDLAYSEKIESSFSQITVRNLGIHPSFWLLSSPSSSSSSSSSTSSSSEEDCSSNNNDGNNKKNKNVSDDDRINGDSSLSSSYENGDESHNMTKGEDQPYQQAIDIFQMLPRAVSPYQKLNILLNTSNAISLCISHYYQYSCQQKIIACDDLLPLFCYVIIKSNLPNLYSECQFIEDFIDEYNSTGELNYYLVTFRVALTLIYYAQTPPLDEENWLTLADEKLENVTRRLSNVDMYSESDSSSNTDSDFNVSIDVIME